MSAKINFQGAAIGNGCWGNTVGTCAFSSAQAQQISADFYFGHGMYSQQLRSQITKTCGDFSTLSPKCVASLALMEAEIGTFDGNILVLYIPRLAVTENLLLPVYNIYDECGSDERRRLDAAAPKSFSAVRAALSQPVVTVETKQSFSVNAGYEQVKNDVVIAGRSILHYFKLPGAQRLLLRCRNSDGCISGRLESCRRPAREGEYSRHDLQEDCHRPAAIVCNIIRETPQPDPHLLRRHRRMRSVRGHRGVDERTQLHGHPGMVSLFISPRCWASLYEGSGSAGTSGCPSPMRCMPFTKQAMR